MEASCCEVEGVTPAGLNEVEKPLGLVTSLFLSSMNVSGTKHAMASLTDLKQKGVFAYAPKPPARQALVMSPTPLSSPE